MFMGNLFARFNVSYRTEYGRAGWHAGLTLIIKEATMSDNLNNRGQQDRSRINVHEKWEVDYWTKELGVTKEELEQAVKNAGPTVNAVRQHLSAGANGR
jgi:hypothetical protein